MAEVKLHRAPEDLFWYWVSERHRIYLKREAGEPKPWTDDPILQEYKFTNVFRQLDAGTVWLTKNFLEPNGKASLPVIAFNIAWYRMFNWIGTGALLGWQTDWRPAPVIKKLKKAQSDGNQIFTGAHIIWGEFGKPKIDGVVDTCTALWGARKAIASVARFFRTQQATFEELRRIRGVGAFLAYEIVSDFRHTELLTDATDINTWANVGPGALRGLRRIHAKASPTTGLVMMRELLSRQSRKAEWVPRMELRDVEHSLCEFDKYCRVKFGEGRPRSKYPGRPEAA